MPAGYSARCKVCNSPHRADIERWAKEEGLSPRAISARLRERGESIGHKSIWQHLRDHFDVRSEAREQYAKSQQQFEDQVKKELSDLQMLDRVIRSDYELHQVTASWLNELAKGREKMPMSLVLLHEKAASEMRQAIKQKAELLGDDPESRKADALLSLADLVMYAGDDG